MKQAHRISGVAAYGWTVVHMALPKGRSYGVIIAQDSDRAVIGSAALVTKGVIECVNHKTGESNTNRREGAFSPDLAPIKAGRYVLTALEDSEWWCADSSVNGRVPDVRHVALAQGDSARGNLLVCSGPDAGAIVQSYTAPQACHLMQFMEARA